MKRIKKIFIWSSLVAVLGIIAAPLAISCSSTNSSNSTKNGNKTDVTLNGNNALSNGSNVSNGQLTDLKLAWNGETNGSVQLQDTNSQISLSTSKTLPENSVVKWYITNDSKSLVSDSILFNTTSSLTTTIPATFTNNLNKYVYFVYAIISSSDATYSVQSNTVSLNLVSGNQISITDGLVNNNVCVNTNLTLSLSNINKDATYTWTQLNHGSNNTTLAQNATSLSYYTHGLGFVSIQCTITLNKEVSTILYTFYVNNWANLQISNENAVNNILTVNNLTSSLTSNLTNNLIPSNTTLTYSWYKQNVNSSNLNTNILFTKTSNSTSTYLLNDLTPGYLTNFKLVISFSYDGVDQTLESNIIQVNYDVNVGSISINANQSITNNTIILDNDNSVDLSVDTSKLLVSSDIISYQWQILQNGSWTNISNATNSTYTLTESNNEINEVRVCVNFVQNWNAAAIYSNTITIQTPAISSSLANEIKQTALTYFNNSSNFSSVWTSYFMNSSNSNYWWLWETIIAGWWKGDGQFVTETDSKYSGVNINNVLSCFKLTGVSIINGTFQNGEFTGNPRLEFNLSVIASNVYISEDSHYISLPQNSSFSFSSPIYISDGDYASNYSFDVASNGAVSYNITINSSALSNNQTNMKYSWSSAWGLNFDSSIMSQLEKNGFFDLQTTNKSTILYNWINSPSDANIVINNSTAPAMPNFYNEVVNSNVSINVTPNITTSSSSPLGFNLGTQTLSVSASLSNDASVKFSYSWSSKKEGASDWTSLTNNTNSLTLNYPTDGVSSSYVMIYQVTITTTYNNKSYTASYEFYVNYEPTDSNTNTTK